MTAETEPGAHAGAGWAGGDRRIVLATRNAGKVAELREILADVLARIADAPSRLAHGTGPRHSPPPDRGP